MTLEKNGEITDSKNLGDHDEHGLTTEVRDDVLTVMGDIDLYVAADFRSIGEKYVVEHDSAIIDLMAVPFLDSAGLAALLSVARVARTHEHSLRVRATGTPRRVLRITGVDRLVTVEG